MTPAAGTLYTAGAGDEIPVLWLVAQPHGRLAPELLADGRVQVSVGGAPLEMIRLPQEVVDLVTHRACVMAGVSGPAAVSSLRCNLGAPAVLE